MTRTGVRARGLAAGALLLLAPRAQANDFWKPFLAGAASGLAAHEASHLALDLAFDAGPRLKGVRFGPVPFFAITHRADPRPRREALISGAGLLSQHVWAELILSRRRAEETASGFDRGVLGFHVAPSLAYAGAAFARRGPFERDTGESPMRPEPMKG